MAEFPRKQFNAEASHWKEKWGEKNWVGKKEQWMKDFLKLSFVI